MGFPIAERGVRLRGNDPTGTSGDALSGQTSPLNRSLYTPNCSKSCFLLSWPRGEMRGTGLAFEFEVSGSGVVRGGSPSDV